MSKMPQEFHVVRCYACQVFQVHQVKKIPKWLCKMCSEKQSLKKEYGRGTGSECRHHVQKLNMAASETSNIGQDIHVCDPTKQFFSFSNGNESQTVTPEDVVSNSDKPKEGNSQSKWNSFIDEECLNDDEISGNSLQEAELHPHLDSAEITLSRPINHGRGGRKYGGWKSGRKRKRDFDQDKYTDPEVPKSPPASQQDESLHTRDITAVGFKHQEKVIPHLQYPAVTNSTSQFTHPKEIANITSITKQLGVSPGEWGMKPTWNRNMNSGTFRKVSRKQKRKLVASGDNFYMMMMKRRERQMLSDIKTTLQ